MWRERSGVSIMDHENRIYCESSVWTLMLAKTISLNPAVWLPLKNERLWMLKMFCSSAVWSRERCRYATPLIVQVIARCFFYSGPGWAKPQTAFRTIWRENLFWWNSFKSVAICARDICTTWILSARIILRIDCCLVDSIKPNVVISFLFFFDRDFSCKSVFSLIKIICFYFLN